MPINNNPFTYKGRIHRLTYTIYIIVLRAISILCILAMQSFYLDLVEQYRGDYASFLALATVIFIYAVVLSFFVTIKRLRDVKQSLWWSLVTLLGPLYIFLLLYLVTVPSRWPDEKAATGTPMVPTKQEMAATSTTPTQPSPVATPTTPEAPVTSGTSVASTIPATSGSPATTATPAASESPATSSRSSKPTTPTA